MNQTKVFQGFKDNSQLGPLQLHLFYRKFLSNPLLFFRLYITLSIFTVISFWIDLLANIPTETMVFRRKFDRLLGKTVTKRQKDRWEISLCNHVLNESSSEWIKIHVRCISSPFVKTVGREVLQQVKPLEIL